MEKHLDILNEILQATAGKLQTVVPTEDNNTSIVISSEILSILKRVIQKQESIFEYFKNKKIFTNIIDLVSVNHPFILKCLLDFLYFFFDTIVKCNPPSKDYFVGEFG